ncbi:HNH endonuclease signature motif containing protein [Nocardioides nitrophenolicus]|uniref:HNH endonuclease signature motif containing protein n=1 Tax=Nocardioides nitrophenolicus TaxID=60489 RepID=UPI0019578E53|nr:HNH endonuclease signature motif containing protein [Nocardioides nitrophenolicus]MBM7518596.1 hypothetical protein [Nocardioides nitrophenolicus]
MSTAVLAPSHPLVVCAARVREALAEVADAQPAYLSVAEKERVLVDLAGARAQLAELEARVLAVAGDVAVERGARDVAAWWAHATRTDPRAARAEVHLARALEQRAVVAAGMREGTVSAAQARVIARAVEELPAGLGPELATRAEATLVGYAAHHPPRELKRLGRRILEVVAPEVVEAEEGRRLEDEERRARETASLRFHDLGDGRTRVAGVLPTPVTQRLEHYLQAFTSPRRTGREDPGDGPGVGRGVERLPRHRAYADAFAALLERLDPARLPEHGGDATTVLVTIDLAALWAELGSAEVIGGDGVESISAAQARRLACGAGIVPVVLGGRGEVLDLGRRRRLFSRAQRRALRVRDRRCRAEGCTIPAVWTEAHHLQPWSWGGRTDLGNAVSLCSHHHHRIHDRAYRAERLPSGDVRFHRRP